MELQAHREPTHQGAVAREDHRIGSPHAGDVQPGGTAQRQ
jgi:hypothetical protein